MIFCFKEYLGRDIVIGESRIKKRGEQKIAAPASHLEEHCISLCGSVADEWHRARARPYLPACNSRTCPVLFMTWCLNTNL